MKRKKGTTSGHEKGKAQTKQSLERHSVAEDNAGECKGGEEEKCVECHFKIINMKNIHSCDGSMKQQQQNMSV